MSQFTRSHFCGSDQTFQPTFDLNLSTPEVIEGPNFRHQLLFDDGDRQIPGCSGDLGELSHVNIITPPLPFEASCIAAGSSGYQTAPADVSNHTKDSPVPFHRRNDDFPEYTTFDVVDRSCWPNDVIHKAQELTIARTRLPRPPLGLNEGWQRSSASKVISHGESMDTEEVFFTINGDKSPDPVVHRGQGQGKVDLLSNGPCRYDWDKQLQTFVKDQKRQVRRRLSDEQSPAGAKRRLQKTKRDPYQLVGKSSVGRTLCKHDIRLTCVRCKSYGMKQNLSRRTQQPELSQTRIRQRISNPLDPDDKGTSRLQPLIPILYAETLCSPYKIAQASLFRDQDRPWPGFSGRWRSMTIADLRGWASPEVSSVEVTHGHKYGHYDVTYRLKLRRFMPKAGDITHKTWLHDGIRKFHDIPAYAIVDMREAAEELAGYISRAAFAFARSIVRKSGVDKIFRANYEYAFQWCNLAPTSSERDALANTLRLWTVTRMTSSLEWMCGGETVGTVVKDPSSPYDEKLPMPPMVCAQLEVISYSAFLHPLRRKILDDVHSMLLSGTEDCWPTVYLMLFILLHSCSHTTRRDEEFGGQMGDYLRFANPDSIANHHIGVMTLLAYFHNTSKGKLPRLVATELIPQTFINLIRWSARAIEEKRLHIRAIRQDQNYGDDYYFVSELFNPNWTPPPIASPHETAHSRVAGP